jgi:NitT/TauT family transport system ATP-binding protein
MDEPFAALDEMTREEMRFLLLAIWEGRRTRAARDRAERVNAGTRAEGNGRPRTVLFVTHSLEEAVLLADRVVVLSARPGRVVAEIPIGLERPRRAAQEDTDEFVHYTRLVRAALRDGSASTQAPTGVGSTGPGSASRDLTALAPADGAAPDCVAPETATPASP